jgi:hypothetical protein
VLHLGRAEHDLAATDNEKAAVAEISHQKCRVVQQRENASRRAIDSLLSAGSRQCQLTS